MTGVQTCALPICLAEVNPNIRGEEVSYLEQSREQLARYLRGAQLKLDAVRVVVAT